MALDPNKKFLYFNKDETSAEMDLALCFPVSSFIGIETQTSGVIHFYFEGSKGADANIIQVVHNQQAYIKSFMLLLVNEINFGDNAFIKVQDWGERNTYLSDVSINVSSSIPPTFTLEDDEFIVAGDLMVNGKLIFDNAPNAGVSNINLGSSFSNNDITLMSAAAINNRFAQINADTTGNAATATLAADATTLATPRAINGVDFDGSAAITVTAAGSTLSDTVTVGKGGTGLTTVAENTMLTGNGTGALTAEANLTYDGTNLQLASDAVSAPDLTLLSTSNHVTGSNFVFKKLRADDTPADGDVIGSVIFLGEDDGGALATYASMVGVAKETGSGEEGGKLSFNVASHDGTLQPGLVIEDGSTGAEVDATIGAGAASVTTVAGNLTVTTGITLGGHLVNDIDVAGEFVDSDEHLMTSAAIDDRIAAAGSGADEVVSTGEHILKQTKVTFDQAACNNLHTGTVGSRTLVAAQGANKMIVPTEIVVFADRASTSTTGHDLVVAYNGSSAYATSVKYARRFMHNVGTDRTKVMGPYVGTAANDLTTPVNSALTATFSAACTTNSLTSLTFYTSYYVIDIS